MPKKSPTVTVIKSFTDDTLYEKGLELLPGDLPDRSILLAHFIGCLKGLTVDFLQCEECKEVFRNPPPQAENGCFKCVQKIQEEAAAAAAVDTAPKTQIPLAPDKGSENL
jgi:hypothetical protein